MTDEIDLFGYLLHLDEPAERQRVEARLRIDPELARRAEMLRRLLEPLETDREPIDPPAGLVARTIGRVAQYIREQRPADLEPAVPHTIERLTSMSARERRRLFATLDRSAPPVSRWRPMDLAVTAAILFLGLGLILAAVPHLRQRHQIASCGNNLRELAAALDTYADNHGGRFPQVGERAGESVWTTLREAGTLPVTRLSNCPAAGPGQLSGYAYTLGFRDEDGQLAGLRRDLEPSFCGDLLPIAADRPALGRTSPSPTHRSGQNVLFVGGHVRFCTSGNVGVDGDDIYLNQANQVRAGLRIWDTVLGVSGDLP